MYSNPKPAKGVRGFILNTFNEQSLFRQYNEDGSYTDSYIRHNDIEVTIESDDAYFYSTVEKIEHDNPQRYPTYIDKTVIDYSPETIGLNFIKE